MLFFACLLAELQAQRAMMVLAAICAVAGVLCGGLGMDCVVAMGDNNAKPKIYTGRTGGGAMLLGGNVLRQHVLETAPLYDRNST